MKFALRSLRVRLCLWYVLLSMVSMSALGAFSYVYLLHALASSRQATMERREARLLRFLDDEPAMNPHAKLGDQLHHFMLASPDTDILEVATDAGDPVYLSGRKAPRIGWTSDNCSKPCFSLVQIGDHRFRTLQHRVSVQGQMLQLTMAGEVDEHYNIIKMVETSYLIFLPLMLAASVAGGFMLSDRALEPVDRLTRAANTISIRDLDRRLPVPQTGDELQRLAETWNGHLQRLESAVLRLTQFTNDLSHDLRTTITVMHTTTQVALYRTRTEEQYRTALQTILQECESTATLLDDLLDAAKTDSARQRIDCLPMDLTAMVTEACDHLHARAEMKHQVLERQLEPKAWISGDPSLVRRLIHILMDNAIKYTGDKGQVTVAVRRHKSTVVLEVCDTGIGIMPNEKEEIFNRFYRSDLSRNRDEGGSGLGLAIAKWIVESHSSEIEVFSDGRSGSTFSVSFKAHFD